MVSSPGRLPAQWQVRSDGEFGPPQCNQRGPLRFSPYFRNHKAILGWVGKMGTYTNLVSSFNAKSRERTRRGQMLRLSWASLISNSLCNRHRNKDNCLATGNWRRGAGRGPEWCAPLPPASESKAHAPLQLGGAEEGALGDGAGEEAPGDREVAGLGRGGWGAGLEGSRRRRLGRRHGGRARKSAPGRSGHALEKEAGEKVPGEGGWGEDSRDCRGNQAGTQAGNLPPSPPCPGGRTCSSLVGRSYLGGGH